MEDKRKPRRPIRAPFDEPEAPPSLAVYVPPAADEQSPDPAAEPVPASLRPAREPSPRDAVVEAVALEMLDAHVERPLDRLRAGEAVADRLRLAGHEAPGTLEGLVDLRHEQDFAYPNGANKVRKHGSAVVYRDPKTVDTIVIHQTACEFGVSNRAVEASGGNIELARARRALDVACHALAFRAGYFVAAHPLTAYLNHGNRFNDRSLGFEIEGRYAGIEDDPSTVAREDLRSTWGGKPTRLDERTIKTARDALAWLVEQGRAEGMPIKRIVSHRQSSDDRRSDPGQEIWQHVVLAFAGKLGLTIDRASPWREGRPVPIQWDPDGIGNY